MSATNATNATNVIALNNISLLNLINFANILTPIYKEEKAFHALDKTVLNEYMKDSQSSWANGQYYLGGHIQMSVEEPITFEKINEVRRIGARRYEEYGGPVNSAEAASIHRCDRQLNQIEAIIQKYMAVYRVRTALVLLETKALCFDVAYYTASYLAPK